MKFFYSVLKATTGSFLAALLDGITPAINVKSILITIRMIAVGTGNIALRLLKPVNLCSIRLIGMHNR